MNRITQNGIDFYVDEESKRLTTLFREQDYTGFQRKIGKLEPELVLDRFIGILKKFGEIRGLDKIGWTNMGLPSSNLDFDMARWYCRNAFDEFVLESQLLREATYENSIVIFPSEYGLRLMFRK